MGRTIIGHEPGENLQSGGKGSLFPEVMIVMVSEVAGPLTKTLVMFHLTGPKV
jgi:hypothetical protein